MKTSIKMFSTVIALFFTTLLNAQTSGITSMLDNYLSLKDALVKSDTKKASVFALEFNAAIKKIDVAELKTKEKKLLEEVKDDLLTSSQKIGKATDIEKQRTAFADLSISLWKLVKDSESINDKVYYDYCPMKKMYWLSKEEAIRNPYYGSKMLTCGNVSDKK